MTCKEVQELLSAYLDGYLGSAEKKELEEHLKSCNKCFSELETLQNTIQLLNSMRAEKITPPPELKNNIMDYVRSENSHTFWHNRFLLRKIAIAAVFLLVLTGSYYFYQVNSLSPKLASDTRTVELPVNKSEIQQQNGLEEQNLPLLKITGKGVEESSLQLFRVNVSSSEEMQNILKALESQLEIRKVVIDDIAWVGVSDSNITQALTILKNLGFSFTPEKIDPLERTNEIEEEIMNLEKEKENSIPQSQKWKEIDSKEKLLRQELEIMANWPFNYVFQIQF